MTKKNRKISLTFLGLVLFGFLLFDYFGPRMIVMVHGGVYSLLRPNTVNSNSSYAKYNFDAERLSVKTDDNLELEAYIVHSRTPVQKGTVIFLHGIRDRKESFIPMAVRLADSSFNSVLLDLRAHGESQGEYCTFGYLEKYDVSNLVDSLLERKNLSNNIGVWGRSLGGAVGIQAMAVNPAIKFGIIESTFSDFRDIVHDYFILLLGFDIPFVTDYLVYRAGAIAGFEPSDVKPGEYAKKIRQPVVVAHGSLDKRISIKYGRTNFDNISSPDKKFIEIPGASHINLWHKGGEEYFREIFKFLESVDK